MITVLTVTYNSRQEVKGFITSLADQVDYFQLSVETLIWDNNSTDGTPNVLRHALDAYPSLNIRPHQSWTNLGLSKAVNRSLVSAKGSMILFCNPDIRFDRSLLNLFDYLVDHPEVDGVVPELLNLDGSVQRIINRRLPTVTRFLLASTLMGKFLSFLLPQIRDDYCYQHRQLKSAWNVEQPGGSCFLMRRDAVVQYGTMFYDEQFPLFWNDVDVAMIGREKGMRFMLVPSAQMTHSLSHSLKKANRDRLRLLFYSRNGLVGFAEKWGLSTKALRTILFLDAIMFVIDKTYLKLVGRKSRHIGLKNEASEGLLRFRCSLQ